jgi:hypothetical protein
MAGYDEPSVALRTLPRPAPQTVRPMQLVPVGTKKHEPIGAIRLRVLHGKRSLHRIGWLRSSRLIGLDRITRRDDKSRLTSRALPRFARPIVLRRKRMSVGTQELDRHEITVARWF